MIKLTPSQELVLGSENLSLLSASFRSIGSKRVCHDLAMEPTLPTHCDTKITPHKIKAKGGRSPSGKTHGVLRP